MNRVYQHSLSWSDLTSASWDYLIVTASNDSQAVGYADQLEKRQELGLIPQVSQILVLADPGGKRVGSGGSTIHCLLSVLNRELSRNGESEINPVAWQKILSTLRILIIHAGGDAKRLPPYSPCGKLFVPVPGENDRALGLTIFDRQLPRYLALPVMPKDRGQIVITSGDVLLTFDADAVSFQPEGLTGVGCYTDPDIAANHGVFCLDANGSVRLFLQKPDIKEQKKRGALSPHGQALLDIGIMNMDAETAVALLELCGTCSDAEGQLNWSGLIGRRIEEKGLDFYSDICCAMGSDINHETYRKFINTTHSSSSDPVTEHLFAHLSPIPFSVSRISHCGFLHFGTLEELIHTGSNLMSMDLGFSLFSAPLRINNHMTGAGS
ncbi:MAG: hypothetical protein MUP70_08445, partial [Candidatus Aminicenantes bacterium]|nr:hypothetical protein [Candidatus Aminicenantes bacterium]